ncbi:MAG: hypothetical protein ACOVP1_12885 [Bacteroidia bacterium]
MHKLKSYQFLMLMVLTFLSCVLNSCGFHPSTVPYEISSQKASWNSKLNRKKIHLISIQYQAMRYDTLHKAKINRSNWTHQFALNTTREYLTELCDSDVNLINQFVLYAHGDRVYVDEYYELRYYEYLSPAYLIPMYRAKHSLCVELCYFQNGKLLKSSKQWVFTKTNDHPYGWEFSDNFPDLRRFAVKKVLVEAFTANEKLVE